MGTAASVTVAISLSVSVSVVNIVYIGTSFICHSQFCLGLQSTERFFYKSRTLFSDKGGDYSDQKCNVCKSEDCDWFIRWVVLAIAFRLLCLNTALNKRINNFLIFSL